MKDLIIQILAMVSEQERNESKRRQAQGIKVSKEKGVYKGRPLLYAPNAKDPQKRVIYHRVVEMLEEGQAIGMTNFPFTSIEQFNDVSVKNEYHMVKEEGGNTDALLEKHRMENRDNSRTPM
ncbi:Putative transposon Tn552 DNA-invertase bin3 [Staphylococcus simulans]|uniref:Transposon Tn552 DNA-invertase bin3 n=1 Tax=Staphylococcus simulans TaxID=1286 RepID=A0A6N3DIT2_STASI